MRSESNNNDLLQDPTDLIGFWSDSCLLENRKSEPDFVDMYLAFQPNGKGFIEWVKISEEIVITFTWSLSDHRLSISGIDQYTYQWDINLPKGERIITRSKSTFQDSFKISKSTGLLSGGVMKTEILELSTPIMGYQNRKFGMLARDINKYRAVLKDVCLEVIDKVKQ